MTLRGWRPDASDPRGLAAAIARYLEWLEVHAYSKGTIVDRRQRLWELLRWCEEREVRRPTEVTRALLERYQRWLYYRPKENAERLSVSSQHTHLSVVRAFFKWLAKNRELLYNPASELELPRLGMRLPAVVLTAAEAEQVLAQPDVSEALGIRDRAVLETFYSTGMRRMELARLRREDLDVTRGTVLIRQGKGKKDRVVPIGERALAWIARYTDEVRPKLAQGTDDGTLFLSDRGGPLSRDRLTSMVREHVEAAAIGKRGSCHLLRHTMATVMLENGADIRYIQQMLGHAKLETTQIYTKVSIRKLKEVHTATHPSAKLPLGTERYLAAGDERGE